MPRTTWPPLFAIVAIALPTIQPTEVRGGGGFLRQPELQESDTESIVKLFHLQQSLRVRRDQITNLLNQKRLQKPAITKETGLLIGTRPEFSDRASSLQRDEFETKAEWEDRVAKARKLEREQVEASQRSWEARKRELLSKERDRLQQLDQELARLADELEDVQKQIKRADEEGPREIWVIWRSPSLPRYDLEKGIFPNLTYSATTVARPAEQVLLSQGIFGGRKAALVANVTALKGTRQYDLHIPNREVAKKLKQDCSDGKVLVASRCKCIPKAIQLGSEIVVSEAVTTVGPERSDPDYGKAAFNIIGSILVAAAGAEMDPVVAMGIGEETATAFNRKTRDVIVVKERQAFTADLITIDVVVGSPEIFRVVGNGKLEPYGGVEVK